MLLRLRSRCVTPLTCIRCLVTSMQPVERQFPVPHPAIQAQAVCCRDGLERIQVPDDATVAQLKAEINRVLDIPAEDMALSKDPKLVRAACRAPATAAGAFPVQEARRARCLVVVTSHTATISQVSNWGPSAGAAGSLPVCNCSTQNTCAAM